MKYYLYKNLIKFPKNQQGFSLVEVLLAIALFALIASVFAGAVIYGQQTAVLAGQQQRAALLAEEGTAAVKSISDANYNNLSDGQFGLLPSGGVWTLNGNTDVTDIFTRQVSINSTSTSSKDVLITVTWQQNLQRSGQISVASRMTNFRGD